MNGKKNFMGGLEVNSVEVAGEFHPQLFADHTPYLLPLTFCHNYMNIWIMIMLHSYMLHCGTHPELFFIMAGNPEVSVGSVLIRLDGPTYVEENNEHLFEWG